MEPFSFAQDRPPPYPAGTASKPRQQSLLPIADA